jgi:hypothetical protein
MNECTWLYPHKVLLLKIGGRADLAYRLKFIALVMAFYIEVNTGVAMVCMWFEYVPQRFMC